MVKVGESLFRAYCTSCHGAAAEGDGPLAKSLRVEPSNLTELAKENGGEFPFERVQKKIDGREKVKGHGTSDMPVWGKAFKQVDDKATDQQIDDKVIALAYFVRSMQSP
ncbi:MAG: cytochrome c [bacterium]|nr:cytochrome c [bacterium]